MLSFELIYYFHFSQEKRGSKSEFEGDPPDLERGVAVLPAGGDGGGGQDEQEEEEEDDGIAGHRLHHADAAVFEPVAGLKWRWPSSTM